MLFRTLILLALDTSVKMPLGSPLSLAFLYFVFSHFPLFIFDITPRPSSVLKMNSHSDSRCMPRMAHPLCLLSTTTYVKRATDEGIKIHEMK